MGVKQRWVTPLMAEVALPSGWGSDRLSGSWQPTLHTPLLKNKDVSLVGLAHTLYTRTHTHQHTVTKAGNIHADTYDKYPCTAHTWPYNTRPPNIMYPWHTHTQLYKLSHTHVHMGIHKRLWKLTPFGAVREESYINDSDRQALPRRLSANTIQQGHLDSKPMTEGADRPTESDTDQMGSFSSRLLCAR